LILKAPFPWFGGKSRVAPMVWERFGDVPNYVEPFAGSLAVLLGRPHDAKVETVNDKDAFLSNFWRALKFSPEETARWADWPVSEADLLARHRWLVQTGAKRLELCRIDPEYYDPKIAGWWVWGLCSWIGSGWCRQCGDGDQPELPEQRPHLGHPVGINAANRGDIYNYFEYLSERLRGVRVCCGDWTRVLGESVTVKNGITAIFLDPPYSLDMRGECYSVESDCSKAVSEWAIANGGNDQMRIALCGYEGEHKMPGWACEAWKATGGYSQSERGKSNQSRERIWFSPHCITKKQEVLAL
jgi:DNA adenine methylase